MISWLLLILSLPTENATVRMRAWRALKACGAAVVRDGVYLLPDSGNSQTTFDAVAADVTANGGSAYVLRADDRADYPFQALFNRSTDYAELLGEIHKTRNELAGDAVSGATRQIRKLRKSFAAIAGIDFFPGVAQKQVDVALLELETAVNRLLSPNEPHAIAAAIQKLPLADYQGRTWATRRRPWVDRLASAWLIRRFIDADARFLWLEKPADCPDTALGFDFDGAAFTHAGDKVTFEVLAASFALEQPALPRIGALVHYLDVGGVQPPDAIGVENVLAGLRETIADDNQLLAIACGVFDGLLATYGKAESK